MRIGYLDEILRCIKSCTVIAYNIIRPCCMRSIVSQRQRRGRSRQTRYVDKRKAGEETHYFSLLSRPRFLQYLCLNSKCLSYNIWREEKSERRWYFACCCLFFVRDMSFHWLVSRLYVHVCTADRARSGRLPPLYSVTLIEVTLK